MRVFGNLYHYSTRFFEHLNLPLSPLVCPPLAKLISLIAVDFSQSNGVSCPDSLPAPIPPFHIHVNQSTLLENSTTVRTLSNSDFLANLAFIPSHADGCKKSHLLTTTRIGPSLHPLARLRSTTPPSPNRLPQPRCSSATILLQARIKFSWCLPIVSQVSCSSILVHENIRLVWLSFTDYSGYSCMQGVCVFVQTTMRW
jgi:hypothetical protein